MFPKFKYYTENEGAALFSFQQKFPKKFVLLILVKSNLRVKLTIAF